MQSATRFLDVAAVAASPEYPLTEGGLRWLLFNREQNGFDRCVVRVGRRVFIDEAQLVAWLRAQNEAAGRSAKS